jgi:hypothetical protein
LRERIAENKVAWWDNSVADFEPTVREAMREKPDFFLKITLPKIITRGDAESVRGTAQVTDSGFQFAD